MGSSRYSKQIEDLIEEAIKDEKVLERIDKLTKGTKLVCIKKCYQMPIGNYHNFRDFLKNRKKEEYYFEEGKIYEVKSIENELINIIGEQGSIITFELLNLNINNVLEWERFPYIFNYFMLESEWIGLQRDEKINEIIN